MSNEPNGWTWQNGSWKRAFVAPIKTPESTSTKGVVCEDCSGTPHFEGSIDDVPLWHPGERQAYGKFAEMIEIEDDIKHAFD